jgi:hypothetical protein
MWMGFADPQVNGARPAPICTFTGIAAARLTTAARGDYFDNGSIRHLSHVILDILQFVDMDNEMEPPEGGIFSERVQYMFHGPSIASATRPRTPTAVARRCCRTGTAGRTTPNAPRRASAWPAASAGRGSFLVFSARPARPTARPCTSAWTAPVSTLWWSPATPASPSCSSRSLRRRRILPHPAHQPGLARPAEQVQRLCRRQRPGALPHAARRQNFPVPRAFPSRTSLTSVIVPMPTAPLACHGVYDEPFPRNRRAVPNDLPCRYEHLP